MKKVIGTIAEHSVWIGTLIAVSNLELPRLILKGAGYNFKAIQKLSELCADGCFKGADKITDAELKLFLKSEEFSTKIKVWKDNPQIQKDLEPLLYILRTSSTC